MIAVMRRRLDYILSDKKGYFIYLLRILLLVLVLFVLSLLCYRFLWKPNFEIAHNLTTSLPEKYFLVVKGQPVKQGDYISFYPPKNPLYGNKTPFIKIVGGVSGDRVTRIGRKFYVNNKFMGLAQLYASNGDRLHVGPTGVIGKGEYYVYTPDQKSYDSRYASIGWASKSRIVGRAYPIF